MTLTLAWRNLWRQPRRTWITVGAMVFSNLLLVFMISLQLGSYDMMINNSLAIVSGHVQIAREGFHDNPSMRLRIAEAKPLESSVNALASAVIHTAPRAATFVLAASEQRTLAVQLMGVADQAERRVSSIPAKIISGQYLSGEAAELIVGQSLARTLGVDVDDELTILGSGADGATAATVLRIGGIFDTGINALDRQLMQMNLAEFQQTFAMPDEIHTLIINADSYRQTDDLVSALSQLQQQQPPLEVLGWQTRHPEIQQSIQADFTSAWFMYAVLVMLVAFSTLNTQLMSVLERTHEFGIMMAIGLNARRLSALVLLESLLMALLGLALGAVLGLLVALLANHWGISVPGMEALASEFGLDDRIYPEVTPLSILMGPLVVFVFSLLVCLYPALRLQKLHPVAAMRDA